MLCNWAVNTVKAVALTHGKRRYCLLSNRCHDRVVELLAWQSHAVNVATTRAALASGTSNGRGVCLDQVRVTGLLI